ncbi:MAG: tail sheath stabilizer and completion protein, partial [Candidatus Nanopelagicales bacterium]
FYHEILRKTIIGFGSLFNEISIKKKNDNNEVFSIIRVPLAYGPTQKFLARLEQQPNLNAPIQMTLPRMSFEFVGLSYDQTRKVTSTQTFLTASTSDQTDVKKVFMPVPYNMDFELNIMCKINDDMLQIIEQIIPYFQPSYNLTIDLVQSIGEKRDIPIVLDNISMRDDYEGDFSTRRALIYTLKFTAKIYLFGPVSTGAGKDIIKKVTLGFVSGDSNSTSRDLKYSVEPVATKDYDNSVIANLSSDIQDSDTTITVSNATNIAEKSYITIDDETLYVSKKQGNILNVVRASYNTKAAAHVSGTAIKTITSADNALIEFGDDFGFSGFSVS